MNIETNIAMANLSHITWTVIFTCCFAFHITSGFNLTILHTNDVHARYNETNKYSGQCTSSDCYAGVARQKTIVEQIRAKYPNTLLLDGGDQFQGTLWFSHYGGIIASTFMNQLDYNVMALGNHEFDRGIDGLVEFLQNATFTVLSCNIDTQSEPRLSGRVGKHIVIKVDNQDIGVIGYTTKDTPIISNPGNLKFFDEVESIKREVQELKNKNVNKIIAVGHAGFTMDQRIAREVPDVDIVVGGHTNTFLYTGDHPSNEKPEGEYPHVVTRENGDTALVVQDYAFGKYMGFLQVEFDNNGKVVSYGGNPILLDSSVAKDNATQRMIDVLGEDLLATLTNVIGRTLVHLEGSKKVCRSQECNLGNVIADGLVYQNLRNPDSINFTEVYIALVNSGSVRATIPKGNITLGQVIEAQPFRNTIEIIKLQGKYLRQALEHSVAGYNPSDLNGKFMQFSGLRVKYNLCKDDGSRVEYVEVLCHECQFPRFENLDDSKMYPILVSNFILSGGDGYSMIRDHAQQDVIIGSLDTDVFAEYVRNRSPLYAGVDGRIEFVTPETCGVSASLPNIVIIAMSLFCAILITGVSVM